MNPHLFELYFFYHSNYIFMHSLEIINSINFKLGMRLLGKVKPQKVY